MPIAVRFRGALAKPERIETFEDHLVEVAVELGGYARIWRSAAGGRKSPAKVKSKKSDGPPRIVRGAFLDLAPGLGTIPLLVSPEGVLMAFDAVEEAEKRPIKKPVWIEVETSFAQPDAHAAVAEFLLALKEKLAPELEVEDDAGYFPSRNLTKLLAKRREKPVPPERESLQKRIDDAARLVRRCMLGPAEHPPVQFAETDDEDADPTNFGTESEWIASHKEQLRRQARMMRTIEERTLCGQDAGPAFDAAMRDEGLEPPSEKDLEGAEEGDASETAPQLESEAHGAAGEPENADDVFDGEHGQDDEDELDIEAGSESLGSRRERRRRNPLMARTMELTTIVLKMPERKEGGGPGTFLDQVVYGILEASGGLAQALGSHNDDKVHSHGLQLVQFRRALQGVNYARAALRPALSSKDLDKKTGEHLGKELAAVQAAILDELSKVRARMKR